MSVIAWVVVACQGSKLAAMSYVSRTGRSPSVDGLDAQAAFMVHNGERLVRTTASSTRTALPIADTPDNRVVVATPR